MKFSTLETRTKGLPEIYAGRTYIEADNVTGTFTFSEKVPVSLKRKPSYTVDSEGNKTQKKSQKGNDIEERAVFLPIDIDGKEYLVASKSPLLVRLFANADIKETQDFGTEAKIDLLAETVEGTFRFCKKPYEYTKTKTAQVLYIEEVE